MSNVIPGAKGPFDFPWKQNDLDYHSHHTFGNSEKLPAFTKSVHVYNVAETLMDEFMQFIDMKSKYLLIMYLFLLHKQVMYLELRFKYQFLKFIRF
jgi:hypothetical protein